MFFRISTLETIRRRLRASIPASGGEGNILNTVTMSSSLCEILKFHFLDFMNPSIQNIWRDRLIVRKSKTTHLYARLKNINGICRLGSTSL